MVLAARSNGLVYQVKAVARLGLARCHLTARSDLTHDYKHPQILLVGSDGHYLREKLLLRSCETHAIVAFNFTLTAQLQTWGNK